MKLGDFRDRTKDLPDTADIGYHSCNDTGCGLSPFDPQDFWIFDGGQHVQFVALNPGEDYDDRRPSRTEVTS